MQKRTPLRCLSQRIRNFQFTIPKLSGNALQQHPTVVVNTRFLPSVLLLSLVAFSGCKSSTPSSSSASKPEGSKAAAASQLPPPAAPVDPATAATITGTISFKGTPPPRVKIDMSMDPACAMAPGDNLTEQYVIDHGKVANVFVYLKRAVAPTVLAASSAPAGQPPVTIDQKGCRFIPHVAAVQQGGSVSFVNSDPTMHNVHTMPTTVGNATVDVSEGPGAAPQVRRFDAAEKMMPIRCNNHPWMNAFLNVAPNPYFAVSGADGSFTIRGVPPGKYILAAVHEKLGEQDIEVDLPAHGTGKAAFVFGPQ